MRQIVGMRAILVLGVVALWRGASELVGRHRELALAGVLEPRIAARREARVERALELQGLAGTLAAVSVGSVRAADVDDVGLLEAAMRRAGRERASADLVRPSLASQAADTRRFAPGLVLRDDRASMTTETRADQGDRRVASLRGAWPVALLVAGAALTFAPLVRPLADVAPWLALAGAALVLAGVLGTRARRG